jgi:hypothetical protein
MHGFESARLMVDEAEASGAAAADRLAIRRLGGERSAFNILAKSGGAPAEPLARAPWSVSPERPKFAIVTGVSPGALMAPFTFLGSAWDARLTDAYTEGYAERLWSLTRLASILDGGLFRPEALDSLIDPFVDAEMIAAVAREHALGRRLLVATTNLDTEQACICDMGRSPQGAERRR